MDDKCWACGTMKCANIRGEACYEKELSDKDNHISKIIALLDDMRMTDKYNSRVKFDVVEWEKELRAQYPELIIDE
jgi:hypothetical protein